MLQRRAAAHRALVFAREQGATRRLPRGRNPNPVRARRARRRPQGLNVRVWRTYEDFIQEMAAKFPHEREGIRKFYDECWKVFNALNSLGACVYVARGVMQERAAGARRRGSHGPAHGEAAGLFVQ